MIVFLTVAYCILLVILLKLKIVKPTTFWKISPLLWFLLLLVALFIPMQWGAPQGNLLTYRLSMEVNPLLSVSGEVQKINVHSGDDVKKGDVLFELDQTPFINKIDGIKAQLELAQTRLAEAKSLRAAKAGSVYDVESFSAQVDQLNAALKDAEFNLSKTNVLAPEDGTVTASTLREGQKAGFLMTRSEMILALHERHYVVWMPQYTLRYVKKGEPVEVTFQMLPGQIFNGTVSKVAPLVKKGTYPYYATAPSQPSNFYGAAIPVDVTLTDMPESVANTIPGGANGIGVVYTDVMKPTQLIRKVMIRMTAWMNYVKPM